MLKNLISFFISINHLGTVEAGSINKVFSAKILISKKMLTSNKVVFANVCFRLNSVYVFQQRLRFKRAMTVWLAYVS